MKLSVLVFMVLFIGLIPPDLRADGTEAGMTSGQIERLCVVFHARIRVPKVQLSGNAWGDESAGVIISNHS